MQSGTDKEGGQNGAFLEQCGTSKKDSLGTVKRKAGEICLQSNSPSPAFRRFKGQWKTNFH